MLKSEQNSSITKNINSANCLEINYYDPYGNKVGAYYSAPANAAIFISNLNFPLAKVGLYLENSIV